MKLLSCVHSKSPTQVLARRRESTTKKATALTRAVPCTNFTALQLCSPSMLLQGPARQMLEKNHSPPAHAGWSASVRLLIRGYTDLQVYREGPRA